MLAVGLARNCGPAIRGAVERVSAPLAGFERVQRLVIESDSADDTVARRQPLRRERPDFESLGELRRTLPLRTDRITRCRNRYLDRLAEAPRYRDVQTLVAADLGSVYDPLTPEGLLSCWDFEGWEQLLATVGVPEGARRAGRTGAPRRRAFAPSAHSRGRTAVEVDSTFGGLGVYRREAIGDSRYIGLAPDGGELCEHPTFHAALRVATGGRRRRRG